MKAFYRRVLPPAPDLTFEKDLWLAGIKLVAGIDEAGRGALAGPVAAAVVVLPDDIDGGRDLLGVRDSKQLTPGEREHWAIQLRRISLSFGVGFASHEEIDSLGIVPATRLAIQRALQKLPVTPHHLLVDFIKLPDLAIPQTCLVKGDARVISIAAASILAKTSRDQLMRDLDPIYPGYGFSRHKGYGTLAHRQALMKLGPCPIHRRTFRLKNTKEITPSSSGQNQSRLQKT